MASPTLPITGGHVDLEHRLVIRGARRERLTEREAALLAFLAARPGRYVTPEALLVEVWGYAPGVHSRTVYATAGRLRAKLEEDPEAPAHLESARGLGYRFTPLAAGLPAPVDAFVGRADELAALAALMARARLVTLLGPGGAGKTRLALRWAEGRGAVFCDLSAARSTADVRRAIASAGAPLVVLDNFEQVVDAAAESVAPWLAADATRRALVTSRHALQLRGEHLLAVGPMSGADGAALFRVRARAAGAGAGAGADYTPATLEALVQRLDGLPLAIELAAARSTLLPPERLGLDTLGSAPADAPARHRTLDAVLGWSWSLLSEADRAALVAASVFRGGFTAEAAAAVLDAADPLGALERLRARSMVSAREGRFSLLESVRAYAARRSPALAADAEDRHAAWFARWGAETAQAIEVFGRQDRLAALAAELDNLLAVAERRPGGPLGIQALMAAFPALRHRGGWESYLERLERVPRPWPAALHYQRADVDFLRGEPARALAGLDAAGAGADLLLETRIARAVARIHYNRNQLDEAVEAWTRAAALADRCGAPHLRGSTLESLGILALARGELDAAEGYHQRALALARTAGARQLEAHVIMNLGNVRRRLGRTDEALACFQEALATMRALGNRVDEGFLLKNIALVAMDRGDPEAIDQALREARAFTERHRLERIRAEVLWCQGRAAHARGALAEAEALLREAVLLFRERGVQRLLGLGLAHQGAVLADRGRLAEAEAALVEAAAVIAAMGDPKGRAALAACEGHLALARGEPLDPLLAEARRGQALSDDVRWALRVLEVAAAAE